MLNFKTILDDIQKNAENMDNVNTGMWIDGVWTDLDDLIENEGE